MQAVNASQQKQAGRLGAGLLPFTLSAFATVFITVFLSSTLLAAEAAPAPSPGAQRDQLILLENDPQAEATSTGDLAATIARLEGELMMSEENLDRARIEYRELSQRLVMIDEQVTLLRNVINVENERLAQLQTDMAAANEAAAREALERGNGLFSGDNAGFLIGLGGLVVIVLGFLLAANARRKRAVADAEVYNLAPASNAAEVAAAASDAAAQSQARVANELEVNLGDLRFDDTMVFDDEAGEEEAEPEVNKIDLATAYMAMGNREGAMVLLNDVILIGSVEQQEEARRLKARWWVEPADNS